jgi:hypothetical protein
MCGGQKRLRALEINSTRIIVRNDRLSQDFINRTFSKLDMGEKTHNPVESQLPFQEPFHRLRRVHIIQGEPIEPNRLALFACV